MSNLSDFISHGGGGGFVVSTADTYDKTKFVETIKSFKRSMINPIFKATVTEDINIYPKCVASYGLVNLRGNGFFIVGGKTDDDEVINETWVYEVGFNNWIKLANCPVKRYDCIIGLINNHKISMIGGRDENDELSDDIYTYDIDTDVWELVNTFETREVKYGMYDLFTNSGYYIVRGNDANGNMVDNVLHITSDFTTQEIISSDLPINAVSGFSVVGYIDTSDSYKQYLIVFGGKDNDDNLLDEVWMYDVSGDSWTQKTSGATARANHSATWTYNEDDGDNGSVSMIVFGGADDDNDLSDVWIYNPADDSWTQKDSASFTPNNCSILGSVVSDGFEFLVVGNSSDDSSDRGFRIFLDTDDTWSEMGIYPEYNMPMVSYKDTIIAYGTNNNNDDATNYVLVYDGYGWLQKSGQDNVGGDNTLCIYNDTLYSYHHTDLWAYDISGDSWTQKTSGGYDDGYNNTMVTLNDKLYVIGSQFWEYDISGDSWTQKDSDIGFNYSIIFDDTIYAISGSELYKFTTEWILVTTFEYNIKSLAIVDGYLIAFSDDGIYNVNSGNKIDDLYNMKNKYVVSFDNKLYNQYMYNNNSIQSFKAFDIKDISKLLIPLTDK